MFSLEYTVDPFYKFIQGQQFVPIQAAYPTLCVM